MNVFSGVRLGLWALIIAVCVTITGTYWTINQTILSQKALNSWAQRSNIADELRQTMVVPKVVDIINSAKPAGFTLLPDSAVKTAVDRAISDSQMLQTAQPAFDSVHNWLVSKSDSVTFSIDTNSFKSRLITQLSSELKKEINNQPPCTFNNSYADLQNGTCRYSGAYSEEVTTAIIALVSEKLNSIDTQQLTQNDVTVPASVVSRAKYLPDMLNLLYIGAIFCSGLLALSLVWLLIKKRFYGLIALGAGGLLGAVGTVIVSSIVKQNTASLTRDSTYGDFVKTALNAINKVNIEHALLIGLCSLGLLTLGVAGTIFMHRRNKKHHAQVRFLKTEQ